MAWGLRAPEWHREGLHWPHRARSHFIGTRRVHWHVQMMGVGPTMVLLHGTGAASHSFAPLAPLLQSMFRLVIIDLPGHGFSRPSMLYPASLITMADDVSELLTHLDLAPDIVVGHSAGAALGCQLNSQLTNCAQLVVAINGAFNPFEGLARFFAPAMARLLDLNPLSAYAFAQSARDESRVRQLITQTGSEIADDQLRLYQLLLRCPGHISGALSMMAHWDLKGLVDEIQRQETPHLFLVGGRDKAVPPADSQTLADAMPNATLKVWADHGHLLHEENPEACANIIIQSAERLGLFESAL